MLRQEIEGIFTISKVEGTYKDGFVSYLFEREDGKKFYVLATYYGGSCSGDLYELVEEECISELNIKKVFPKSQTMKLYIEI